ncbi:hypothetical protein AYO40_06390 [Planctomycetaceae bacterium SCGC AG-212-D15]|nr:hypothetical protein AYO40_06390 [Planctomycetaceae bacterium SCGC AG-212-D15]
MNRRFVLKVTAPTIIIGLLLFASSVASVWSINRLHRNLATILSKNVASLMAAQELEIRLRQLRFHSLIYQMDRRPERYRQLEEDEREFEQALGDAKLAASTPEQESLIATIDAGYLRYRDSLAHPSPSSGQNADFIHWADEHSVRRLASPCHELLRLNKEAMERTARESEAVSAKARLAMILVGILGPLSGLVSGYGIARGLNRSISRLIVRLQDVRAHLDQDVASIKLAPGDRPGDLDAQLDHVVSRVREVAEQAQQHQREMLRTEQLAAVGQLAASVAHEVRNPLTGIKLLVGAAINTRNSPPLTLDDLQVIHGEINRMEQTVQGLLDFARPREVQRAEWDLRDIVHQALDLVRSRANQQHVDLRAELPGTPFSACVDRDQLANVFVNLLMNALDALPKGGAIDVSLAETPAGDVRLRVRDSGPGLSDEMLGKLFAPFASSKPTGTGLGLSICRRIVEGHGGAVVGRNAPDGGAEFEIVLPRTMRVPCRDS